MAARVRFHPSGAAELDRLPADVAEQIVRKIELLREFPFLGAAMYDAYEGYRSLLAARNRSESSTASPATISWRLPTCVTCDGS